ncbi:MAG: PKD domain-containing protein, partial [Bacteroidota bacterium]
TFVKGNGVCQRSSSMTIRVIENVILTLMEMPDTCVAIQYTPQPLLADAVYTVDGIVVSNANFPIELNNGQHTILAELDNECGYQSQPDTFTIAPAVPVTILRPAQDTTVCEDSTPILLGANTDGGQWQGEHIVNSGGQFFFEPNEVGTFTITFVKGNGVCQRSSSMTIRVIENVILTLMEMPDTCVAIQYTPQPLLADAVYTVNGTMVPNASFPIELNDGQHTILAELDNECGYQSQPDTFIITPAVAVTIVRPAQDTTVCEASMAILLGADTDGGQWQGEHVVNSGGQLFFEPNEAGTFTVAFVKGNGVCQRTDERTITVIPNIMLDLEPTPDTCIELSYTPNPFFSDALYIIDGDTIPNSDFPRPLAFGSHTIEAILSNACGVQTDSDDFLLSPPVEVSITLPTTDTSICLGSAPLLLEADPPGGSFLLPTGEVLGSSTTFSPVDTGTFLIIYRRGNGPCERRDSLWVQVQGVFATIEPLRVCPWSDPQLLVAEPPGGQFFSTDCPACVQGDRFVPANLPGATAVEVFYLVADELGCEDTTSMVVEVLEPQAAFEIVSPLCIGTPLEVDPAAAIGERFLWRVDGQERPGPPFVGLAAGAHTIELVAITAFCRDSTQQTFTLLTPPRSADFSISDEEICPGEGVFFSRTPTPLNDQAGDLTYTWAFGRFVNDTLITPDPLDSIYFENMTDSLVTFRASLTVSNGCGSITQDTLIRVFPEVIADLGIDSTKLGCSPFKVLFTDRSRPRNWIDSCRYDLGDGTIFRTCRDTFSHTFTNDTDSTIAFPVLLTAYGVCNTDYSIDTIRVIPDGVEARFNIEDDQYIVCPNKAIQFTDASTPKPTSWSWDFGDNTRDNVANPIHTFTTGNDTFNIRLRVSTGCGFDQIDRTLITLPEPLVDFIAPEYTCEGAPIQGLENRSPEDHEAYYWDYGNGQRDSNVYQPAPPPVYTEAGTRATIRLEVVDFPNQCTNSLEKTVLIRHQPRPVLDSLDRIVCPGSNLTLEVDTVGWFANQLIWEHKGRVISEQTLFSTDFGDPGADSIVLIASYDGVCVDSVLRFLEVKNCDLYIPNAFTPNNDGNNDHFTVYAPTGAVEEVGQFRIFDRWGNLLFEANADFQPSADQNADQDQGWDGHFNNEPMNSGVYVYVVKVRFRGRSTFEEFRGTVTLLR